METDNSVEQIAIAMLDQMTALRKVVAKSDRVARRDERDDRETHEGIRGAPTSDRSDCRRAGHPAAAC
jgi:hypothetical protein